MPDRSMGHGVFLCDDLRRDLAKSIASSPIVGNIGLCSPLLLLGQTRRQGDKRKISITIGHGVVLPAVRLVSLHFRIISRCNVQFR